MTATAGDGTGPTRELERLVGDVPEFLATAWQRAPVVHRATEVDGPLGFRDVDELLAGTALRLPYLAMSGGGEDLPPSTYTQIVEVTGVPMFGVVDADKVHQHLRAGNTLALFMLDHLLPEVRRYRRRLSADLGCRCSVGACISPDDEHAFPVHADQEDTFIRQLAGGKKWTLWDRFPDYRRRWVTPADLGEPVLETRLGPGDCLYVPRGTPHLVESVDSLSLHLTISALVPTVRDELLAAVRTALADPGFDVAPGPASAPDGAGDEHVAALSRLLARTGAAGAAAAPDVEDMEDRPLLSWAARVDVPGARWRWTPSGLALRTAVDPADPSPYADVLRRLPAGATAWPSDEGARGAVRKLVLAGLLHPADS